MQKITSNYSENRYWVSGWWGLPIPLKNDGVKVSWYYDIPNIWKVIKNVY